MRLFAIWAYISLPLSAANSFSIQQVLSAPFPSDLVADRHSRLAWVQNAQGVRNIWIAQAPNYSGHQLTTYTEDDGQEISDLSISADGAAIVYTRGESQNAKGESPNPRHLVGGIDQMVLAIPFAGGAPREIGKGHTAAISPDCKTVSFVSSDQVWSAPLDGTSKAAQLIRGRGAAHSLKWSPDGKSLAIVSRRVNHSFIAVYEIGSKAARFLDPSTDMDDYPVWSPDSRQIAFVRQQVDVDELEFAPHRADAEPWSIRIADVATGKGIELWKAQPGAGSRFYEITGDHQILWTADQRIVFPWEQSGTEHIYAISAKGGTAADLTIRSHIGEVEQVSLSPDRRTIFFASNEDDPDLRHLWRIDLSSSSLKRVTPDNAIEWSPVPIGDAIAFLHSDGQTPARAAVLTRSGIHDLSPQSIPADFPLNRLTSPHTVTFSAADGLAIHAQIFLPHDGKSQHPAVIFFHGGSRRQMLPGWHYMFYYNQAYGFNQYLASRGYVVLSVNYRSGIGYGLDFRQALNYGAAGASEFSDVLGAGLYLRSRPDVIPNKIGLWGGSYGGFLTALGLARASDIFAAGVDLHGVHEWNDEMSGFVPSYEPEKRQEIARLAFQSSPMAYISTWKSPVLLIHGDDDRNVNFKQSVILAQALRKQNVPFEELIFPDEIHDFLTHDHWLQAYSAAAAFLDKYLKT